MAQPITISITALANRINATPQAVKNHLDKLHIEPIGFADLKKKRPLYSGDIVKRMKGCKTRKKPVQKSFIQSIRLNETEHEKLSATANKYGMSIGEIMKKTTFNKAVEPEPVKQIKVADPHLLRQLTGIGNNLNQIAKAINYAKKSGKISQELALIYFATIADIEDQLTGLKP